MDSRKALILHVDARCSRPLQFSHHPRSVHRITKAGFAIRDKVQLRGVAYGGGYCHHLTQRDEPHVGSGERRRRDAITGQIRYGKPGSLDEFRAQSVVNARRNDQIVPVQQGSETFRWVGLLGQIKNLCN